MFNNKKSLFVFKFLIRIIISLAVIFLVLVPACGKIRAAFFNTDTKYIGSFEEFVGEINQLSDEPSGTGKRLSLELNKKSAIIGFRKSADGYECKNCYFDVGASGTLSITSIKVDKPANSECNDADKACVCLCNGKFELEHESTDIESVFGGLGGTISHHHETGRCTDEYICVSLKEEVDIVEKTIIKENDDAEWSNGFLFLRDISGLRTPDEELITLFVQKGDNEIGVCNEDMLDYNKDKLNLPDGVCINKDWAS